jgi:hypothetical protein
MCAACRTPVHDILHHEDVPQVRSTWEAAQVESAAAGGRAIPSFFVCRNYCRDGSVVWVETISCITPTNFYGLSRNVNDRKALEVRAAKLATQMWSHPCR